MSDAALWRAAYQKALAPVPVPVDEEWRPIPGWERVYDVSNRGAVYSARSGKCLKTGGTSKTQVVLADGVRREYRMVQRLVYEAFIGPVPDGAHVGFKDDDPSNLDPSNLFLPQSLPLNSHRRSAATDERRQLRQQREVEAQNRAASLASAYGVDRYPGPSLARAMWIRQLSREGLNIAQMMRASDLARNTIINILKSRTWAEETQAA